MIELLNEIGIAGDRGASPLSDSARPHDRQIRDLMSAPRAQAARRVQTPSGRAHLAPAYFIYRQPSVTLERSSGSSGSIATDGSNVNLLRLAAAGTSQALAGLGAHPRSCAVTPPACDHSVVDPPAAFLPFICAGSVGLRGPGAECETTTGPNYKPRSRFGASRDI